MSGRVLVVASEFPPGPGGMGTHAFELARHLHDRGYRVRALVAQDYVGLGEREAFNASVGFEVVTLASGRSSAHTAVLRLTQLRRAMRGFRPDAVVASGMRVVWLVAAVLRRSPVPWIAVGHGLEFGVRSPWQLAVTRRAYRSADAVVCVSDYTRHRMLEAGVHPIRTEVIPNGADVGRFRPDTEAGAEFRARHGLGEGPLVLTVGQVWERKGQWVVVEALPTLIESVPDVRYVVVGEPTEAEFLLRRARQRGVAERVHVLGRAPAQDLVGAYNACDVFCMASVHTEEGDFEGFGIAAVEAALCGKPAVVSAGSGLEEAVSDGQTGLVVEEASAMSVAQALARVLGEDDLRRSMGEQARDRALREQTWAVTVDAYERLLVSLARRLVPPLPGKAGTVAERLLVVSHTPYHRRGTALVGFGPTVRELDQLASLCGELVHVAPLHDGSAPESSLPHGARNITVIPVSPAGGPRWRDKARIAGEVVSWWATIRREARAADVVHVRCPAGISLVALVLLCATRAPRRRWIKYAGNWRPGDGDAYSYRIQRWMLRRNLVRAAVTVNGRWRGDGAHVHAFDNPTMTDEELEAGRRAAAAKRPPPPVRLVFVGRMEPEKGVGTVLETARSLESRGAPYELDLIGEGPMRADAECFRDEGREASVRVHGPVPRSGVEAILAEAHLILLPTTASEGFPKVLGEAMGFGVVPVAYGVSSIPQILGEVGCGVVVDPPSARRFAEEVLAVVNEPARWSENAARGVTSAGRFSYRTYLQRVTNLLGGDDGKDERCGQVG